MKFEIHDLFNKVFKKTDTTSEWHISIIGIKCFARYNSTLRPNLIFIQIRHFLIGSKGCQNDTH